MTWDLHGRHFEPPEIDSELKEWLEACRAPNAQDFEDAMYRAFVRLEEQGIQPTAAILPQADKATVAERRLALLVQWETATGRKRSQLYSKRLSDPVIISKNQFYGWLHGDLPSGSKAARRLEAYLTKQ